MDSLNELSIWQSILYGIVQGLGEFLPISSSGHLVILPHFMNWKDPGLNFNIALHLGTLFAVFVYFKKDWYSIFFGIFKQQVPNTSDPILRLLIIGSVPGAIAGLFLKDWAETVFRSPILVASTLIGFGFILYLADRKGLKTKVLSELTMGHALFIGCFQAIALVPGVSRSGITITAALLLGLNRESSSKFSFLLSAPIIAGASLIGLKDMSANFLTTEVIAGVAVSFISGALSIHFLMKWVSKWNFAIFSAYRLILGVVILALYL